MHHGILFLRSRVCTNVPDADIQEAEAPVCQPCLALSEDTKQGFGGITDIVHRKDRQINALNLIHLNLERKLLGRATAENVERLVRVALSRGRGIRGILEMYEAV